MHFALRAVVAVTSCFAAVLHVFGAALSDLSRLEGVTQGRTASRQPLPTQAGL